ncbi:MAG TPA: bifunctional 4-hydroxy-2-oxoglutarate aldolase/2-dehydro-3-deoxy-phosphogluconate aldolase [Beutenbergiaceae bacterium]|nr:bifunctional 4-hydroxy-2-oxoglutarate aldolase/2-dehydro-3-deoxy-phosphogluconate aldolase [Beutenbergiaceae bacterium]
MSHTTDLLEQLGQARLVPVVVLEDAVDAAPLAEALVAGGLAVAEVTFRTEAALAAIQTIAARGDVLLGAGTVLSPDQVDAAVDAGAQYIVSPGLSEPVVRRAAERGVLALPGTVTATEIQAALEAGLRAVKYFPAGTSGGAPAIKALSAPFPEVQFVPTGGVGPANLGDYLSLPSVLAVGGSWMVPKDVIAAGDFEQITALTAEAVQLAAG